MHEIDSFVDGYTLRDLKVMEKLLAIRNRRIDFAMHHHRNTRGEKMNFVENPFLPQIYNSLARVIAIQGSVQSKKAQPLTSKVHTPTGWKLMGELKIGDLVSTPDGGVAPITGIQPQGTIGIYKIVLSDGRIVEACGEHLWNVTFSVGGCSGEDLIITTDHIRRGLALGIGRFLMPCVKKVGDVIERDTPTKIEEIVFVGMKEAQCIVVDSPDHLYITDGYVVTHNSEFMIIDHLAQSAEGLSVFFVLPKVEARVTYVQNRVDKRIRESSEYRKLVAAGAFDNALIKGFGRGTIKYVGSNVVSDFKEFPGDSLFVEEVDECHETNIEYGRDRLRGSIYQFRRYVGNPRLKGRGINKYYRKTNQNRWHIPCRKCGQPIELDWFKTVIHQKFDMEGNAVDWQLLDQDWKPGCGRDVHCMCPKCNVPIDRLGKNGLWIPADPEATMEGYHMTMLNSWENNISEMVETWQQAWDDVEIMQLFYNSYLGVPYSADQARLTEQMLQKCAYIHEPYAFVIKNNNAHVADDCCKNKCSMGIDVGKKFDVRISEILKDGRRRAVFIGKVDTREELINLGRRYNVYVAVIDSMPEYRVVMDLQADAPFHVWACRYESEGKDRRAKRDRKNRLISGDRTVLMDRALSEIKSGRNILPTNYKSIMKGKYVDEMLEPVRQEEKDSAGNVKFVWSKGEDHQRHCDVYDMLAADLCEVGMLSGIAVG